MSDKTNLQIKEEQVESLTKEAMEIAKILEEMQDFTAQLRQEIMSEIKVS